MPLTTAATWPDLIAGKKAKASEVEAKFDFLSASLLPHYDGEFTDNAYDVGSASYQFRSGYFGTAIYLNGQQIAESSFVKAWLYVFINVGAGTISATDSFNISSVVRNATGQYTVTFTTPFTNSTYAPVTSCFDTARSNAVNLSTTGCLIQTQGLASTAYTDTNHFSALFAGDQ